MGKLRRYYLTLVKGRVEACGHRFDNTAPPRTNCEYCWTAYFQVAADIEELHKFLAELGVPAMRAKHGSKFVKMFERFLTQQLTLAREATQEGNSGIPETTGSTEDAQSAGNSDDGQHGEVPSVVQPVENVGQEA